MDNVKSYVVDVNSLLILDMNDSLYGYGYNKTPIYFPEAGTDFIFGVFALTISTQIPIEIFRELTIICGWVLMWTIIELEIFDYLLHNSTEKKQKHFAK